MALGQGIHFQAALPGAGHRKDGKLLIEHKGVRIVVHQQDAVLPGKGHQFLEHIPPGGGAGGHVGVVHPHELDTGKVHSFQLRKVRIPSAFLREVVFHQLCLAHAGGRCVCRVAGVRHQHFVAGIKEGQRQQEDALLGAGERLDFRGGVQGHAVPLLVPIDHGLPEFRYAGIALIAVHAVFAGAAAEGLHGLRGRRPVRRSDAQVYHRVQSLRRPFPVERGNFPVLAGKIIFLNGKCSVCGGNNHKALLYSPSTSKSSMSGRTAARACV